MTAPTGMLRIQRPGHRAPKGFRSLPHPQRYTAAPGDFVGGGLRSWLAVRCTRTAAHRPPGTHSLRSRHSRAAASTPASLPSLTVPRGYASVGRLAGSGASTLSMHGLFRNGPLEAGGIPHCYARDLRPLAAGSARRNLRLAPQAASRTPPHIAPGPRLSA